MALDIPGKYKIRNNADLLRKHILRDVAKSIGVPDYIVVTTSKIMQFGSMSMFFVEILNHLSVNATGAVFASVIGSNIGAYLSPIGALAGIMWLKMLHNENIKLNFVDFVKYGVIISIPVLLVALGSLSLSLALFQ